MLRTLACATGEQSLEREGDQQFRGLCNPKIGVKKRGLILFRAKTCAFF